MNENSIYQTTSKRLPELLRVIKNSRRLLILTHNNPDPDALGSAFGLRYLARRLCENQASVAYGGIVGRAENRALLKECRLKPHHLDRINWRSYDALALVDHQPSKGLIRWPAGMPLKIVIDHHPRRRLPLPVEFVDVRKGFGSNAALLFQYLKCADISIPKFLATALMYGIRSDTQELSRGSTENDLDAVQKLFTICDFKKLHAIQSPTISTEYVSDYWAGIRNAIMWGDTVTTFAGEVDVPDLTSEIADRMIHIEKIKWSLAAGFHNHILFLSVRARNGRRDMGKVIRKVVGKRGSAGGHGFMAGAHIANIADIKEAESLAENLSLNFVKVLHPVTYKNISKSSLIEPIT